jgi:hypothetical protein
MLIRSGIKKGHPSQDSPLVLLRKKVTPPSPRYNSSSPSEREYSSQ